MVVPDSTTKGTKNKKEAVWESALRVTSCPSWFMKLGHCRINRKNRIDRSLADTVFLSALWFHLLSLTFPGRKSEVACGRVDSDAWENS